MKLGTIPVEDEVTKSIYWKEIATALVKIKILCMELRI